MYPISSDESQKQPFQAERARVAAIDLGAELSTLSREITLATGAAACPQIAGHVDSLPDSPRLTGRDGRCCGRRSRLSRRFRFPARSPASDRPWRSMESHQQPRGFGGIAGVRVIRWPQKPAFFHRLAESGRIPSAPPEFSLISNHLVRVFGTSVPHPVPNEAGRRGASRAARRAATSSGLAARTHAA
jgi:hypothetical protein